MTYATFTPIRMACTLYDGNPAERFRTGTPTPSNGTLALSGYHAYRSLCWFDSEEIAAALTGMRAVSIAISCQSLGNPNESAAPCPLQLYRTALAYDAGKAGLNSADTLRPDLGMTCDSPVNEYFIEYARTEPLERGGALTRSVFMTGDAAARMAQALSEGYALGSWNLKSGTAFPASAAPYCVRYLTEISVTLGLEPVSRDVLSPDHFAPTRQKATAGGTVTAAFSGTVTGSAENPVTGYLLSFRDRERESGAWGDWSEGESLPVTASSGTLTLPVPAAAGVSRAFRIAAVSAENTGEWREMTGTVTAVAAPEAPAVKIKMQGYTAVLEAEIVPDPAGGCRYLMIGGEMAGMTGPGLGNGEGGTENRAFLCCRHLCGKDDTEISVTVTDEYGGVSPAVTLPVTPARCFDRTAFCFRGVYSEDLGIRLLQTPDHSFAPAALQLLRAAGSSESTVLREGEEEGVFLPTEAEMLLYVPAHASREALGRALQGEGMLRLGAEPRWQRKAVILSLTEEGLYTDGGRKMKLRLLLSPFRKRADGVESDGEGTGTEADAYTGEGEGERPIPVTQKEMLLYFGGAAPALPTVVLTCTGDVTLSLGGKTLKILNTAGQYTVDCEKRVTTGPDGEEAETAGDYPCPAPGRHILQLEGNITGGSILRGERFL